MFQHVLCVCMFLALHLVHYVSERTFQNSTCIHGKQRTPYPGKCEPGQYGRILEHVGNHRWCDDYPTACVYVFLIKLKPIQVRSYLTRTVCRRLSPYVSTYYIKSLKAHPKKRKTLRPERKRSEMGRWIRRVPCGGHVHSRSKKKPDPHSYLGKIIKDAANL